jgi:transcriptional regulator with XRE-family HTH domain
MRHDADQHETAASQRRVTDTATAATVIAPSARVIPLPNTRQGSVALSPGRKRDGATVPKNGIHPTDKHVGQRVRMRRLMLGMSQTELGNALGLTFQQVQKYEKGSNRISASRLQRSSEILQVPVTFFFEGAPHVPGEDRGQTDAPFPEFMSDYLATSDGLQLTKAFMQIPNAKLRRAVVNLVEQIAGPEDQ